MYILSEQPYISQEIGLFARKNGKYTRPIVGVGVDFRIEDMKIPYKEILPLKSFNFIGKLPNIDEIGQFNKYFICTHNNITSISSTESEAFELLNLGHHILLPDSPKSELWKFTNSPWWEYCFVLDRYYEYIKAPKIPRIGEPSPEDIDEKLDEFQENIGKLMVTSPTKLKENKNKLYLQKLSKI